MTAYNTYTVSGWGFVPQRVRFEEYTGKDVITYGRKNTYAQEVEYAVCRSGIASACLKVFSEFLYGNGFEQGGDSIVNARGETLNELLMQACYEFALYGAIGLQLNVNLLYEYTSIEAQNVPFIRLSIPEDRETASIDKVKVWDNWAGESWRNNANINDIKTVCLFNPEKIEEQIREYESIGDYNGQMLYFTLNGGFYDKSPFDSVIEQILTNGDLSEFDRQYVKNGFSVSKLFFDKSEKVSREDIEHNMAELKKLAGVHNAGGLGYFVGNVDMVDPSSGGKNITEQYNVLKNGLKDDICEALGIPPVLLGRTRQGGFPNQEELVNAFAYYNGMIKQYQAIIAKQFNKIAQNFAYPLVGEGQKLTIAPKAFDNGRAVSE